MVAICGEFDVEIKLPPVPKTGMYELRLGYSVNPSRGIIQVYLNGIACGVPVNLQQGPEGWKEDTEDEEENRATDKSMHNRGFMKAPDSQGGDISNGGTPFRAAGHIMRRVLYTGEIRQDQENWVRFRQLLKGNYSLSLDYIELCPKNIYASPEGEDTH